MKTIQQIKSDVYNDLQNSGFLKNVQSQIKARVFELIDKQTTRNKQKLGFQYQHPLLKKLRNFPLTSLCMDLIQQFLQSFKFKHTLNVFKKQINRDLTINRSSLKKQFTIDLQGKSQSVLLSIVGQIVNGDIKIIEREKQDTQTGPRKNNFMNDQDMYSTQGNRKQTKNQNNKRGGDSYQQVGRKQNQRKAPQKQIKPTNQKYDVPDPKKMKEMKEDEKRKQQLRKQQQRKQEQRKRKEQQEQKQRIRKAKQQQQKRKKQQQQKLKEEKKQKGKGKKNKKEQQKPPQGASDLMADVLAKFVLKKADKKAQQDAQFKARKAFSQQKEQKKIVPQESGSNKIRGISMGKIGPSSGGISSFMKFSSFNNQSTKGQQVKQQVDQLQQSKDSTRRNPLYSSSESGFDKSVGYDQSVDSMAIQDYEYVQQAKKFTKK